SLSGACTLRSPPALAHDPRRAPEGEGVRKEGVEPSRVSPPDPKSGASASSATFASGGRHNITTLRWNPEPDVSPLNLWKVRWRIALFVAALAVGFLPIPASVIESVYSDRLFPIYQIVATSVSNHVTFALLDVLVLGVTAWWLVLTIQDILAGRRAGAWLQVALRIAMRTLTVAAVAYVVFLLTWGFNYRRVRLEDKVQFDRSRISREAAVALAEQSVMQVNALYESAHRMGWVSPNVIDRPLADAFASGRRELGSTAATGAGLPNEKPP